MALKSAVLERDLQIDLPGITWSKHDSMPPGIGTIEQGDSWQVALIDFMFAMNVHTHLLRQKISEIYNEPEWADIISGSGDPANAQKFFVEEKAVIDGKMDQFLRHLNSRAPAISNPSELMDFRRHISSHFALGGLAKLVKGGNDEI